MLGGGGSHAGSPCGGAATSMRTLWPAVTCAVQPGSTTMVEMTSTMMAGPGTCAGGVVGVGR